MSLSRKFAGRLFQTRGPATAKLLSPNVLCVRRTAHDLSVDEQSQRRGPSETKYMSSCVRLLVLRCRMKWLVSVDMLCVSSDRTVSCWKTNDSEIEVDSCDD